SRWCWPRSARCRATGRAPWPGSPSTARCTRRRRCTGRTTPCAPASGSSRARGRRRRCGRTRTPRGRRRRSRRGDAGRSRSRRSSPHLPLPLAECTVRRMDQATPSGDEERRSTVIADAVEDYVLAHLNPGDDEVTAWLAAQTRQRFGDAATMAIGRDQGMFMQLMVELTGARSVAVVGTFTGMSALWIARGLPDGGRLTCFEHWGEAIELARDA